MPNPTADFPIAIHTPTDVSGFSTQKLGLTTPRHTVLEGKIQQEIVAIETKIGTGSSTPTNGKVLYSTSSGQSAWADLATLVGSLSSVSSVNSKTGAVVLTTTDIAEGSHLYYTDVRVRANRLDQMTAPTASVSMNSQKITNVLDPASAQDAATKAYVDAVATGLSPKTSVRLATTSALAANTYNNGASGVGATLTANANGALSIDGQAVSVSDRVLIKNEVTGANNGIYTVTQAGDAGNPYILTRTTDNDQSTEFSGAFAFVIDGATNINSGFVCNNQGSVTVGTTAITFTQFSSAGSIIAGTGLTKTGSTLDVIGTSGRIIANADSIDIDSGYVGQASITTLGTITTGVWNGTAIAVANGGTGATTASGARTNLGLGTIATQDASSVTITGGSITGITDLTVADGGTGASDAAGARTNLGAVNIAGDSMTGALSIASTSANSLAVGPNGTTNPVLKIDASAVSQATGLRVQGQAAGSGIKLTAISSGTNERLLLDAKGNADILLQTSATGNVGIGTASPDALLHVAGTAHITGTLTLGTLAGVLKGTAGVISGSATLNDLGAPTTDFSMNSHKITNVTDPTSAQDAATKNYVDTLAQGLSPKPSAVVATTTTLPAYTYSNGTSGLGATLTGSSTGVLTIDGHAVALNEYVLVKDETSTNAPYNGLYKCTTAGAIGVAYILTRAVEMDITTEFSGSFVFVELGTVNGSNGWVCTNSGSVTVGTTNIVFSQFSGAGQVVAGSGLTKTGNQLDVIGTTNRITANADSIDISASYVGQASITTLGTITTGIWTGTAIAVANGGTGGTSAATARTNLGAVNIAGDTMTGLLQFSGTGHAGLTLNSLTTTQRDALTPASGNMLYNATASQVQKYENSQWVDVSKSPATKVIAPASSGFSADYYTDGTSDDVQIQQALDTMFSVRLTFGGLPTATQTIIIGADTYTFVASGASGFQVNIGATGAITASNLLSVFNAHNTNSGLVAAVNSTVFTLTGKTVVINNNATNVVYDSNGGGLLFIKKGTYSIDPGKITLPINTHVYGEGWSTLLQLSSAGILFQLISDTSQPAGFRLYNDIQHIRFDGGTFLAATGIDCGTYGQEFNIKDCWFYNFGSRHDTTRASFCINVGGTNKKFQIEGNWFGGSQVGNSVCIRLSTTGDVAIVGNNFHDFYDAIYGNTEKTQITGNDIYNGDGTGINVGTTLGGLTVLNISNNTISDCNVYGIKIGLTASLGVNIVGNFFRNINDNAIWLRGSNHTVIGNYFQNIARTGVGSDAAGITLNDGCTQIVIHGNNIYNTHANMTYGIAPLDTVTGGISIKNNSVTGAQLTAIRQSITSNEYQDLNNHLLDGAGAYIHRLQANTDNTVAGNSLTVGAGSATPNTATNKNGGNLILAAGQSTGSGTGQIILQISPASSSTLTALKTITVNNRGSGYAVNDVLTVSGGGGTGATITVNTVAAAGRLLSIALNAVGTGYVIGDILTLAGGSSGTVTVNQVDFQGKIISASLTANGSGYSNTTGVAVTGGTGTGATFDTNIFATGAILTQTLTTPGTGYVVTTGAATTGGTGTGATFDLVSFAEGVNTLATAVTIDGSKNMTVVGSITAAGLNLTTNSINTVGNIELDGTASRDITVGRQASGGASTLTVQAGGAISGSTDNNGATLILAGGIATGNGGSAIDFYTTRDSQGAGTTDRAPAARMRLGSSNNGRLFIGGAISGSVDGLELGGEVNRTIQSARRTASNTAGSSLTIKSSTATSGATDKAGGDLILASGISTGTAKANVRLQVPTSAVSTGTSDNTLVDRLIVTGQKILTNNSAIAIVDIALPTLAMTGGMIIWTVESTDGTDMQVVSGVTIYSAENKGGVYVSAIKSATNGTADDTTAAKSVSTGTITTTWTIVTGTNKITLTLNANASKIGTGYPRVTYTLINNSQQAPTIL